MGLKERSSAIFVLLRPYSLPGIFLLYYIAKVITTRKLTLSWGVLPLFIPIFLAWTFLTLLLEAEHKHSNREKVPYSYPAVALIFTTIFALLFNGFVPILPLLFFIAFTYLYTKKNSIRALGNISFFMRGLMEFTLFLFALSLFSNVYLTMPNILFGFVILVITSARNLIGDIRDTKVDELTFTATFGDKSGYLVSVTLYSVGGCVLFLISQGLIGVIFPIILMVLLLLLIDNGHMFHRLSVLLSAIIMAAYILFVTGNDNLLILLNLLFLSIISSLVFYNLVPRKSNPQDVPTTFGFVPWSKTSNNRNIHDSKKQLK